MAFSNTNVVSFFVIKNNECTHKTMHVTSPLVNKGNWFVWALFQRQIFLKNLNLVMETTLTSVVIDSIKSYELTKDAHNFAIGAIISWEEWPFVFEIMNCIMLNAFTCPKGNWSLLLDRRINMYIYIIQARSSLGPHSILSWLLSI